MTDIIVRLVVGAIAGVLADFLIKGIEVNFLFKVIIGVIGGYIGGWLFSLLNVSSSGWIGNVLASLVGALILADCAEGVQTQIDPGAPLRGSTCEVCNYAVGPGHHLHLLNFPVGGRQECHCQFSGLRRPLRIPALFSSTPKPRHYSPSGTDGKPAIKHVWSAAPRQQQKKNHSGGSFFVDFREVYVPSSQEFR
jgi:uncharacterized membrane protein YeaQ/YmgE (transglycosylase-associated protein family)